MDRNDPPDVNQPSPFVFGMAVGALMGGLAGLACEFLLGCTDTVVEFVAWSVGLGVVVGAATVAYESYNGARWHDRPDIATHIGLILGIAPGILVLPMTAFVRGKFSGYLFIGVLFAGPMAGMLIGGVLDRIHDALIPSKPSPDEPPPDRHN
jgi:hypothetical protein